MAGVKLDRIGRKFVNATTRAENKFIGIDDISFEIPDGEFWVLVGPSGCGKSTLLRILAGLDTKSSGIVKFAPAYKPERVSFVFQDFGILPWLTVEDNVALNLIGEGVRESFDPRK